MKVLRSLRRLFGRLVMVCAMLGVLLFVCILGPVRLCRAGGEDRRHRQSQALGSRRADTGTYAHPREGGRTRIEARARR